ncbi:MAG: CPBP family intramembrane metalloprotease [Candidatus Bathyarchaeota archaeon]|nr:CPBP family intramembrane metalloprotease [Candidatus Bathyarchaeota archaeon]
MQSNEIVSPLAAVIAVAATFFIFLFIGAVLLLLFDYPLAAIFGELLIIAVPLGYMLYKKIDVSKYIGLQITTRTVLLGVAVGAFLFLFDVATIIALTSIFGTSELVELSNELVLEASGSTPGLLQLIAALSLAGLCEEFTFRGFLQTSIQKKYPLGVALFISSLAFGLFHFDLQAVYTISAFLMGLVLGYVYHRWRSYTVSALAHATVNLIVLALFLLPA